MRRQSGTGQKAYQQGHYDEAQRNFESALKEAEQFGSDDARLATSLNDLASVYKAQGKYAEAEPLHKRALAIREKALGPEHPDVAKRFNNLALLYHVQGRYAEAEAFYMLALSIDEKSLEPEHPNLALRLENYAALLRETGRPDNAEELEARAKAIRAKHAQENPVE